MDDPLGPGPLVAAMTAALTTARKARDKPAVAALQGALAAIANAGAVPVVDRGYDPAVGVGAAEAARRELTADQASEIVRAEVDDLAETVATYREHGRDDEAHELERRIAALHPFAG